MVVQSHSWTAENERGEIKRKQQQENEIAKKKDNIKEDL